MRTKSLDVPDLHGFGWDSWGEVDEHEERGWMAGWIEDTNATHTHNRLFFIGPIHQPNGIARKRPTRSRIPHKRLARAIDRVPKRKRVQIDRITKAKDPKH
jgi:hypothetical protein